MILDDITNDTMRRMKGGEGVGVPRRGEHINQRAPYKWASVPLLVILPALTERSTLLSALLIHRSSPITGKCLSFYSQPVSIAA